MIAAVSVPMNVTLKLLTDKIDEMVDDLEKGGGIVAEIYNDAQSADGVFYWNLVNDGRGPVRPVHAKALHWIDPLTGKDVFSMYSGPVAPRHIRENSIPAIQQAEVQTYRATLTRETLADIVNAVAEIAVFEMQSRTPVITGLLHDSYRIVKAEA